MRQGHAVLYGIVRCAANQEGGRREGGGEGGRGGDYLEAGGEKGKKRRERKDVLVSWRRAKAQRRTPEPQVAQHEELLEVHAVHLPGKAVGGV